MTMTTRMAKPLALGLVLAALVVLAACSGDSPTAPKVQPTPGAATVTLTASPSSVTVGFAVQLSAAVKRGGSNVADGTSVTFVITGCVPAGATTPFFENSTCEMTKATTNGVATTLIVSTVPGTFEVRAAVPGVEGKTNVQFKPRPGDVLQPPPAAPAIYSVSPDRGYSQGGDQITITGLYLCSSYNTDGTCAASGVVNFSAPAGTNLAVVNTATAGSPYDQLVVTVPPASINPLQADFDASISVDNKVGSYTKNEAYKYLADQPTPQIYALQPNSGPIEGGTVVTITGKGFQPPVQVLFGDHQAVVRTVNFNEVVCVAPNISPAQPNTPTTLDVTVKNVNTGKLSNAMPYRYGEALFISGMSPVEGPADKETVVTIYGQGFTSPVKVTVNAGTPLDAEVLSVAGTEIQARFPALPANARGCADIQAAVSVTNINSNLTASSNAPFTYRAVHPLITSVEVDSGGTNVVQQFDTAHGCSIMWGSHTVIIHGSGFTKREGTLQSSMVLSIGGIGPIPTTFVSENQVTATMPDLTGISLQQISCRQGGACGSQYIDTPVSVTVTNQDNSCSDTLTGGLVIRPCDTSCRLSTVASITLSGPTTTQTVGTPFQMTLTVSPVNPTAPTTISISYDPAFTGPGSVTIPLNQSTAVFSVTPIHAVTGGQIIASAGAGDCAVYSNPISVWAMATLNVSLTLNAGATGSVTSSPTGINCGTQCSSAFTAGTVTLTATPAIGSFGGWSGDCGSCATTTTCEVTLDQPVKACVATFNNP